MRQSVRDKKKGILDDLELSTELSSVEDVNEGRYVRTEFDKHPSVAMRCLRQLINIYYQYQDYMRLAPNLGFANEYLLFWYQYSL